tara:strand:- start:2117 stop:2776 length:660 start_codon:yes stop_codon:yes gene_type:complete
MADKCYSLLLFLLISFNLYGSEIIYNKNNILITKQDIEQYKSIEKDLNYYNDNIIIKEIVLIKRTINNLKNNNPRYFEQSMSNVKSKNFYIEEVDQNFLEEYLFYINVRNDIAREFMSNKFDQNNLKSIFENTNITFGLSKNECMTIYQTISIKKLNIDEIYNILNRGIIDFKFKKNYENEVTDVCLSEKITNQIIQLFNNYMIEKSREDFLKFIYEKK